MAATHKFETLALHAGFQADATGSRGVPVYRTSSYLFRDTEHAANLFSLKEQGNIYTRIMNPTQEVLEKRMAALEGGAGALALSSGTSAVFYSVINVCGMGDEVVASSALYGGSYTMLDAILPEMGIQTRFVNCCDPKAVAGAVTERTRMIFTEVIGNPSLDVVDLEALAEVAREHHLPLVVDSTFTPPCLLRPLEHGADVVVHSMTKWLGGHGSGIGGIVVDGGHFDWSDTRFRLYNEPDPSYHGVRYARDLGELNHLAFILRMRLVPLRNLGACLSPDNAWMFLQGLETLSLRMQRHCENALQVAAFLENHPGVSWVRYPGLKNDPSHEAAAKQLVNGYGGMVVFGIRGGAAAGKKFIEGLSLFSHLANVGDARSLAIHPASTTHAQLSEDQQRAGGTSPDMVRLSVGIEHIDDIIADLEQALDGAG